METEKNLGIYIHIPFCAKKCRYCDFTSFAGKYEFFEDYTHALVSEIIKKAPPGLSHIDDDLKKFLFELVM